MYCQKCGNKLIENVKFCKECGSSVSDIDNEKLPTPALGRFANYLLDRVLGGIVCCVFFVAIWGLISVLSNSGVISSESTFIKILNALIPILIALSVYNNPLYYLFFEGIWGRSLGKWITKTKVVRMDGEKPKFLQILGRSFARWIPFEAFSFLVNNNPIGWHDRLSKTLVVPASYTPDDVKNINFKKVKNANTALVIVAIIGGLLVFIAIIGILASVVLASLNSARQKGSDASIKASLSSVRATAEIYYSDNNSYLSVCYDPQTIDLLKQASKTSTNSEVSYVCNDSEGEYAASVALKSDGYWCVDSLRDSIKINTPLDSRTYCSTDLTYNVMQEVANEANKELPKMIDSETRLDSVTGGENSITYNFTLVNYNLSDLKEGTHLSNILKPNIVNSVCSAQEMKIYVQNKAILNYSYNDKNGLFIETIVINTGTDCK